MSFIAILISGREILIYCGKTRILRQLTDIKERWMSEISTIQISYSSVSDSFLYTGQKYLENTAAQHNRIREREGHPFLLPHFDCLSIVAEKSNDMCPRAMSMQRQDIYYVASRNTNQGQVAQPVKQHVLHKMYSSVMVHYVRKMSWSLVITTLRTICLH